MRRPVANPLLLRIEGHIPALRRYAKALTRGAEMADDLVQDCLERAVSRASSFRADGDLRAWLFSILHNVHLDELRRRKRRGEVVEIEAASGLATGGGQEIALEVDDVLTAFDRLSDEQREMLLLIGVEDMSYEEAAQALDLPLGTVMSRLFRARERLRAMLEARPPERLRIVK